MDKNYLEVGVFGVAPGVFIFLSISPFPGVFVLFAIAYMWLRSKASLLYPKCMKVIWRLRLFLEVGKYKKTQA